MSFWTGASLREDERFLKRGDRPIRRAQRRTRMDVDFSNAPCGKPRIKSGESALQAASVGIGYAHSEQYYCSMQARRMLMATGMTKTQLVRHMAEKHELNNKQAAAFLDSLAEVAIKETKKNGVFIVPGLGRLVKSNRKARMGRNPQTGEAIKIPAKTVVKFRVAKAAKDAIAPKK